MSRLDTLRAPPGARRAPLLVILTVLLLVVGVLILAVWQLGWLVALLLPVVVLCTFIAINTVRTLRRG